MTCPSAKQQLTDTLDYFAANNIGVARRVGEAGKENSPSKPLVQRLFLDIEDPSPSLYFDPDPAVNQLFVSEFVAAAADLDTPLGFYTTSSYWSTIMANSEEYSEEEGFPLWYPRWDGEDNMDFFVPFGGWDTVRVKQTAGDVGLCGVSQVDMDYMEL